MDTATEFAAGDDLELIAVADGQRRDVLLRRPGRVDFLIYDGNIAGIEVEMALPEFEPASATGLGYRDMNPENALRGVPEFVAQTAEAYRCATCGKDFPSEKSLQGHIARVHRERKTP